MDYSRFDLASLHYFRYLIVRRVQQLDHSLQRYEFKRDFFSEKIVDMESEKKVALSLLESLDVEIFIRSHS